MEGVRETAPKTDRCGGCAIRGVAICTSLTEGDRHALRAMGQPRHYGAGDTIFGEDERFGFLANVVSGVVKLSKTLPDGRQQIIGVEFAGDFLGRIYRDRTSFRAEAVTPVHLCCYPRARFEALVAATRGLEERLFRDALDELDSAREWMVLLGRQSAREKVARFLQMIARRNAGGCGPALGARFELPLSRADMADFLGLTVETVSRQMTRLKTEGLIRISNNRIIEVEDVGDLEAAAGGWAA
ncbi:cyclic nucleotide-binding domain-containing protein [Rhizobiales bacterium L72]|uniref:Cyclic nucleotide-binding domain-containing protein n=2 Tax=Propylenella binzhouense TaxID=2555902 RepID=A0A964T5B8_9HYPH|nr:cyclic nucleotide-binding domain-containing protein [Propylenella binzhouense]